MAELAAGGRTGRGGPEGLSALPKFPAPLLARTPNRGSGGRFSLTMAERMCYFIIIREEVCPEA